MKITEELKGIPSIAFLVERLRHNGDSIDICMLKDHIEKLLDLYKLSKLSTRSSSFEED